MGAPRAHGSDVADRQVEREAEKGDVELGVVGEDADGGAGVHFGGGQVPCGQSVTTSSACGKRARVAKTGRASHTVTR